jgi:hypothetical protein
LRGGIVVLVFSDHAGGRDDPDHANHHDYRRAEAPPGPPRTESEASFSAEALDHVDAVGQRR